MAEINNSVNFLTFIHIINIFDKRKMKEIHNIHNLPCYSKTFNFSSNIIYKFIIENSILIYSFKLLLIDLISSVSH